MKAPRAGSRDGFCRGLNATTLIWAVGTGSVYRSKNKAIYVPFALRTRERRVDQKALLDSGATECFVHPRVVKHLKIKMKTLQKPCNVRNVDGTPNRAGKITEAAEFVTNHAGMKTKHVFFVADIGPDNYILGFPFLEANEPTVDWAHALVEGSTTQSFSSSNHHHVWYTLSHSLHCEGAQRGAQCPDGLPR